MSRLLRFCLATALFLLAVLAQAEQPAALDLDQQPDALPLVHGEMGWLRDAGGQLSLADVQRRSAEFQPVKVNFNRGFTTDTYWLRLPLQRQRGPADWWLELRPASLDDISLYLVRPDGSVYERHTGDRLPMSSRDADYSNFILRLSVPEGQSTAYLRIKTSGSMVVLARLQKVGSFPVAATHQYLQAGLYLGVIFTVVVLSTVYVAIWRRRLYAIYLAYLLCQLLLALSSYGLLAQYVVPSHPFIADRAGGFSFSLTVVFGMLFFSRLLDLHEGHGARLRVFQVVVAVGSLAAVAALFGEYNRLALLLLFSTHLAIGVSLYTLARRLVGGQLEDRMFALSFICYMAFISSAALRVIGFIPVTELSLVLGKLGNCTHLLLLQLTVMLRSRAAEREVVRARQESEQQQRVVAEQEQFLAMITHEIRTPLSVISAASESLRMIDPGSAQQERLQRYERIAQAVRRVDHLLNLAVSRDRLDDAPTGAPVRVDVVAMTRQLLTQMVGEQQQRTSLFASHDSLYVQAHPALLQFSLLNLIDNACKYSPPASPIVVDIHELAGGELSWSISDRGPGVCAADRERIFEKYFRSAEHAGIPGLGLGLFIAQRLLGRFGGHLNYRERSEGGACFEVTLPQAV